MKAVVAGFVGALGLVLLAPITRPQPPPAVRQFKLGASGQTVTFLAKVVPDESLFCAERLDTDVPDCKPVHELRKWLRERPSYKK